MLMEGVRLNTWLLYTGFRLTFILSFITTKGLMVGFAVFSPGSKICSYLFYPLSHCSLNKPEPRWYSLAPCLPFPLLCWSHRFIVCHDVTLLFVLVALSYCDRYHGQDELGREQSLHLIGCSPPLREATQELKTRAGSKSHGGTLLIGLVTPACARPFVHNPGVTLPTGQFNQVNLPVQSPSDNFGL